MTAEKPEIDFPEGPPPENLEITDISVGSGAEASPGDQVRVHYVGVAHSTGEEFDASYNRGAPLQFRLGVGQVIAGWDQGVQGMKVGGRRRSSALPGIPQDDAFHRHQGSPSSALSSATRADCGPRVTTSPSTSWRP